jgi:hypothetical protein
VAAPSELRVPQKAENFLTALGGLKSIQLRQLFATVKAVNECLNLKLIRFDLRVVHIP